MDFDFSEDQQALRGLARRIFTDHCSHERLKEVEASPDRFDDRLWAALDQAGLLDASSLGWIERCIVLEEAGRAVARVPLLPVYVSERPGISSPALSEPLNDDPLEARTSADAEGRLSGVKTCVPWATRATEFLVAAEDGLYAVDAPAARFERQEATNLEIQGDLVLDGTPSEKVGGPDAVRALRDRTIAAVCVMQAGVCDGAVRLMARYTSEREQFGRPLAANQAVSQRAADAYIDTEAITLTAWQAVWRMAEGMPADRELAIAKFWAADGSHRAIHAAQHLHGGIGVDVDYPLHRYFLWAKELELTLGGATPSLLRLGAMI